MKTFLLAAALLFSAVVVAQAQSKEETKSEMNEGSADVKAGTKKMADATGKGVKRGAKKTKAAAKKGAHKVKQGTNEAAAKVKEDSHEIKEDLKD